MRRMKQDTRHHRCALQQEQWDLVSRFIDGGIFVNLRRTIKRLTMIDMRHPLTLSYAPSLSKLRQEEKYHLIEHYSMIHPLSMFSLYFNMIVAIIFVMYFVVIAIIVAITSDQLVLLYVTSPLNFAHLLLIIVTFCTGHYDDSHNMVFLNRKDVLMKYAQSYMIVDIIAFLPLFLRLPGFKELKIIWFYLAPFLILIRYIRYIWCLKVLKTVRLYYRFSIFMYSSLTLILNIVVLLVLAIYILHTLLRYTKDAGRFVDHARDTLKMIFMVDDGPNFNKNLGLRGVIIPIMFILAGFIFHLIITVQIMEIWFRFFSAENKQNTVYNSIDAYTRYKALPVSLRRRILLYLEFKYQGHFYKDTVIRKATSSFLRKEIILAATKESTQNVELFKKIPVPVLKQIRTFLVSEIYLPGDPIIKAGNTGHCMFFLVAGTVVITNTEDNIICYLRDGSQFGELALIVNKPRVANAIAVTPCELYKLNRQSFWEVVKKYPELRKEIELMVADRIVDVHPVSSYPSGQWKRATEQDHHLSLQINDVNRLL